MAMFVEVLPAFGQTLGCHVQGKSRAGASESGHRNSRTDNVK